MLRKILKWALIWVLGFLITAAAAVYQRMTGPTYPKKVKLAYNSQEYPLKLIRSQDGNDGCKLVFHIPDTSISAKIAFRRFPLNEGWKENAFLRSGEQLAVILPDQPAAGKLEYKVEFYHQGQLINNPDDFHTIVRFKDEVPPGVLIPHIFLIFFAMLLSNITCYLAIVKSPVTRIYTIFTLVFMLLGGMIMGPFVQYFAFGEFWTGIPFGWDLTDNKTLIAFVFWVIAFVTNRRQPRYGWVIVAALVTIIVFSIPHSLFGSEFNYATGQVTQG